MPAKPLVLLDDEERIDDLLPDAFAVVGQPDLSLARIEHASKLRAVLNVEGNFLPNVDYTACFDRGIHVLACGPAFGEAVAEYALGLGPVSRSMFAIAGPEAASGGTAGRPTYNSGGF